MVKCIYGGGNGILSGGSVTSQLTDHWVVEHTDLRPLLNPCNFGDLSSHISKTVQNNGQDFQQNPVLALDDPFSKL